MGRGKGRFTTVQVGETYGIWKVLEKEGLRYSKNGGHSYLYWTCQCVLCGKIMPRSTHMLKGGCDCRAVRPDAAINRSFRTYIRFAKLRGFSFELSFDVFKRLISVPCSYCGKEPEVNSYSSDVLTKVPMNGIDRRDSNESYMESNCVPCCTMCNLSKLDWPEEVFIAWVNRLVQFQGWKHSSDNRWIPAVDHTPAVGVESVPKPEEELENDSE